MVTVSNFVKPYLLLFFAVVTGGFGSATWAEGSCTLPDHLEQPRLQRVDCSNDVAPDSWVLALSWSPKHCATVDPRRPKNAVQCGLNRFGFVAHGLWGQRATARGKCEQPRHCAKSLVPQRTIRETLCTIPGVELIQGEWQKHGTCSGMSADDFFAKARALWSALVKPDVLALVNDRNEVKAGRIAEAFVAANRASGLFDDAVAVRVASGNQLDEVLVCYDLDFRYAACTGGRTPARQTIKVVRPRER
jgi:ribonuclease T2